MKRWFKRHRRAAFLLAALICGLVLVFSRKIPVHAGFGDYNDYSDSGWGGNDSDSGWNSGGGWDSDSDWDSDDDDRDRGGNVYYGGGYYGGGSGSSGSGVDFGDLVIIFILIAFVLIVYSRTRNSRGRRNMDSGSSPHPGNVPGAFAGGLVVEHDPAFDARVFPNRDTEIEQTIRQTDPAFSVKDFIAFVKNVYMDIQDAWCKRDLSAVRPILQENLYYQTTAQIEKKKQEGIINALESIAIGNAYTTYLSRDAQFEYLTVYLVANMIDYQYREQTGELIRGNKTTRWELAYRMRFQRPRGTKTGDNGEIQTHTCPNCGAPLEAGASVRCPYCGSVINTGRNDWVLAEFQTVQRTMTDEGIHWPDDGADPAVKMRP